jgi:hypothetical protein
MTNTDDHADATGSGHRNQDEKQTGGMWRLIRHHKKNRNQEHGTAELARNLREWLPPTHPYLGQTNQREQGDEECFHQTALSVPHP